mmetsp:Transcript_49080/g.153639  ORF Transcript_49080/g.153639 Transcript_49080/m.153639 type:complete len:332 (-) Transcript_49080:696-1691(-)
MREYLVIRWHASSYSLSKTPLSFCGERALANSLRPNFSIETATGLEGPSSSADSPMASMRFRSSSTNNRSRAISASCFLQSSRSRMVSSLSPGSGGGGDAGFGDSGLGSGFGFGFGFGVTGAGWGGGVAGGGLSTSGSSGAGLGSFLGANAVPTMLRTSLVHVSNGDTALTCASRLPSGEPSLPMKPSTPTWPLEPGFRRVAETTPNTLRRRSCVRRSAFCDSATMGSSFFGFAFGDGDGVCTSFSTSCTTSFSTMTSFSTICGGLFARLSASRSFASKSMICFLRSCVASFIRFSNSSLLIIARSSWGGLFGGGGPGEDGACDTGVCTCG